MEKSGASTERQKGRKVEQAQRDGKEKKGRKVELAQRDRKEEK